MNSLLCCAAILIAGGLAACGTSGNGPISGLSPTRSIAIPTRTSQPAPTAPATSSAASAPATTRAASTPRASASGAAAESGSGSTAIWWWVALAVVVVGGLITWIALAARRRSAASADQKSREIEAYARGAALYDAMSVAETPGAFVGPDAAARWSDIQVRADSLAQTLYALRERAADDSERMRATELLTALQAVRSAMDAERAPTGAGPGQAQVVRGRLADFETALRAFRAGGQPAP
ncbi:MAG TPA: hypothetical protein VMR00_09400 [Streptosporangiaceae bacterium]|nr:hypothetical protein [Streptosporangiaceae bacterium]